MGLNKNNFNSNRGSYALVEQEKEIADIAVKERAP